MSRMKQNKDHILRELTNDELDAVTGGQSTNNDMTLSLSDIDLSDTPAASTKNSLITAEAALRALAIDLKTNDLKNAQADLKIAEKALGRVQRNVVP